MERVGDLVDAILPPFVGDLSFRLIERSPDLPEAKVGSVFKWTGRWFEGPGEVVVLWHGYINLKINNKVGGLENGRIGVWDTFNRRGSVVLRKIA